MYTSQPKKTYFGVLKWIMRMMLKVPIKNKSSFLPVPVVWLQRGNYYCDSNPSFS